MELPFKWIQIALALLLAGCGVNNTLVGFPDYSVDPPALAAKKILGDIQKVGEAIDQKFSPVRCNNCNKMAKALLEAYVTISNEWPGSYKASLDPFFKSGRPPLFLYPRLTRPHLAETQGIQQGDSKPDYHEWYVPIILNKDALLYNERDPFLGASLVDSAFLRGSSLDILGFSECPPWIQKAGLKNPELRVIKREAPEKTNETDKAIISFWLSSHGHAFCERDCCCLDGFYIRPETVTVSLQDVAFTLPDARPDALGAGFLIPGSFVKAGYYDLNVFPRIHIQKRETSSLKPLHDRLAEGDWWRIYKEFSSDWFTNPDKNALERDLRRLSSALEDFPILYFARELEDIADAVSELQVHSDDECEKAEEIQRIRDAIAGFLERGILNAQVLLDEPAPPEDEDKKKKKKERFSFVVAGDLQYHKDLSAAWNFLRLIDPELRPDHTEPWPVKMRHPTSGKSTSEKPNDPQLSITPEVRGELLKAKFVVLVGDLGDGAGLGNATHEVIMNSLGLWPPTSPYSNKDQTSGEFVELARAFSKFRKPVFAVPGNHDGYANSGGIVNWSLKYISLGLKFSVLLRFVGDGVDWVNENYIPVTIKTPVSTTFFEFYDGLKQWSEILGPRNVAFQYRGQTFVALNSYELLQPLQQNLWVISGSGSSPIV